MQLNHHRVGSGPPLVLIHGIGSRWQVWEPVLDRVAAEREVVAIDMPGFGASPPPAPGTPPGPESLTRLIGEFIAEVGLERPHVGGNSLGGRVALELAKLGQARSATVMSPQGFHNRAEGLFQYASLWTSRRTAQLAAPRADRLLASAAGRRIAFAQVVADPERVGPRDAAESVRALADATWYDETLPTICSLPGFTGGEGIEVPVTIAWGDKDHLLLPRQAGRAAREVPRARMITLYGAGHVPTYDDPDRVAAVLLEGSED